MSKQYTSNVSNVIYDPVDGAGLNNTVAADNISDTKTRTIGGILSTADAEMTSPGIDTDILSSTVSRNAFGYLDLITLPSVDSLSFTGGGVYANNLEITFLSSIADLLNVGDYLLTNQNKLISVVTVPSDTTIQVDIQQDERTDFITGSSGAGLIEKVDNDAIKGAREGEFMAIGLADNIAGSANTAILGGSTEPNRGLHASESTRTVRTATAIRSGHWNEYSGEWSTEPVNADDTSIIKSNVDTAYSGDNRVTYLYGGSPTNSSY